MRAMTLTQYHHASHRFPLFAPRTWAWGAWRIATWLLLATAGLVGLAMGSMAIAAGVRGEDVLVITSGSMEPTIPVAAAIFVKPVNPRELAVGDVVTFGNASGRLTTHRIVGSREIDGIAYYRTKGDANVAPDPNLVAAEAMVGRTTVTLPHMGRVLDFSSSLRGRILLILLPVLLLTWRQVRGHIVQPRKDVESRDDAR